MSQGNSFPQAQNLLVRDIHPSNISYPAQQPPPVGKHSYSLPQGNDSSAIPRAQCTLVAYNVPQHGTNTQAVQQQALPTLSSDKHFNNLTRQHVTHIRNHAYGQAAKLPNASFNKRQGSNSGSSHISVEVIGYENSVEESPSASKLEAAKPESKSIPSKAESRAKIQITLMQEFGFTANNAEKFLQSSSTSNYLTQLKQNGKLTDAKTMHILDTRLKKIAECPKLVTDGTGIKHNNRNKTNNIWSLLNNKGSFQLQKSLVENFGFKVSNARKIATKPNLLSNDSLPTLGRKLDTIAKSVRIKEHTLHSTAVATLKSELQKLSDEENELTQSLKSNLLFKDADTEAQEEKSFKAKAAAAGRDHHSDLEIIQQKGRVGGQVIGSIVSRMGLEGASEIRQLEPEGGPLTMDAGLNLDEDDDYDPLDSDSDIDDPELEAMYSNDRKSTQGNTKGADAADVPENGSISDDNIGVSDEGQGHQNQTILGADYNLAVGPKPESTAGRVIQELREPDTLRVVGETEVNTRRTTNAGQRPESGVDVSQIGPGDLHNIRDFANRLVTNHPDGELEPEVEQKKVQNGPTDDIPDDASDVESVFDGPS